MIADDLGRRFESLRISLTAACNYACTYCVPDGKRLQAKDVEWGADDLLRGLKLLSQVTPLRKIRLTGGEPLLAESFDGVIEGIIRLGFEDVSITTNGQLLGNKLPRLKELGLSRLNISLDTLDDQRFREIARSGDLATVVDAIKQACELGFSVKINMVPMRGANDDQIIPMMRFAHEVGAELRFIELMKMGHLHSDQRFDQLFIGSDEILTLLSGHGHGHGHGSGEQGLVEELATPHSSTARRYQTSSGWQFGIIANETKPFCAGCDRLRLASNGMIYGCLSSNVGQDLGPIVALAQSDLDEAKAQLTSLLQVALDTKQRRKFVGEVTVMKFIGG